MQIIPDKNAPNIAIFVLAVLGSAAAVIFYTLPTYGSWQQARSSYAQNQQDLQNWQQLLASVQTSINQIHNTTNINLIDLALPDSTAIPDFYAHIESLAKSSNLTLATVSAQEGSLATGSNPSATSTSLALAAIPNLGVVDATLEVNGTIDQLNSFLMALEKSMRFIDVQDIDIGSGGRTQSSSGTASVAGALSFRLTLKSYYLKQQ